MFRILLIIDINIILIINIKYQITMSISTKIETQIKQLSYQMCEIQNHDSEPLSRICIDKQCNYKTLICSICEEEKHKGHETIPLKNFLVQFYESSKDKKGKEEDPINPLFYANKIDELKNSFFNNIHNFRTQVNEILQDLQNKAKIYFNNMSQKLLMLIQFENPLEFIKKQGLSQQKMKKYMEQILDHVKIKQKMSLSEKLNGLFTKGKEKEKHLSTSLAKIKTEVTTFASKIQQSLDPKSLSVIEKILFRWSQQLKGTKMKLTGTLAQQTGMESSGQRFIMCQPSLTQGFSGDKITWGIKVIKFVGWIGVGMSLKNVITKANFMFNYSSIGHGSYMISNNGYSWSHSAPEFNSAHKTFHYAVNDIVYMEYDKINKKLRFRKNLNGQKFELDIADPPFGDNYHPCANICSTGDTIQIINPGIPLS